MKPIIFLLFFLITIFSCQEKNKEKTDTTTNVTSVRKQEVFTESFKNKFAGTWQKETQFQTNTIQIQFEPGKNYATIIDIGSGEAPPLKYQAFRKETMLYISPKENSEYCELKVKNNQLIFIIPAKGERKEIKTVFDKVK